MKLPLNGSLLANALLVLSGALLGAAGYWTADYCGLTPDYSDEKRLDGERGEGRPDAARNPVTVTTAARRRRLESTDGTEGYAQSERIAHAVQNVDPRLRSEMLRRAGAEGARRDLSEALRMGHELKRQNDRLDYFRGLFGVWAESDPEAALSYAKQTFAPGLTQSELVSLVVNKWGAVQPEKARVWTEGNLSGAVREQALTDLMIGWTRRSPELAAGWIERSESASQGMLAAVGRTWAERDPEAASVWVMGLPRSGGRDAALLSVASEYGRQDPEAAVEALGDALEEGGPASLNLATVLADVWATVDPEATALWISEMESGGVRDQAAGVLATVWSSRDIESAVLWAEALPSTEMREQVISHLSTTWGAMDPLSAVEWLASLQSEEGQRGARGAFNSWAAVDPDGMRSWIGEGSRPEFSDTARKSLADVLSQSDVFAAMELAFEIEEAKVREDSVTRYYKLWKKRDAASAGEWLNAIWKDLPESLQGRLDG